MFCRRPRFGYVLWLIRADSTLIECRATGVQRKVDFL
jgi:hypothetical protein